NNDNNSNNKKTIDKFKRIYLNTYVIPLIYLINSFKYQKYLENISIINYNINLVNSLDYYKRIFFDYNVPITKNINVIIYKNYFGSSKKNNSNNRNNNGKAEINLKIDKSKINTLISELNKYDN